jgi:hypothetical protein
VQALSSRPSVAMTIDVGDTPTEAKALLVRGLAIVDIVDGVPDEYLAASTKALGADEVTEFERQVRSMYDRMARICIEPVWARFFDFGAGRMPSLRSWRATPKQAIGARRRRTCLRASRCNRVRSRRRISPGW